MGRKPDFKAHAAETNATLFASFSLHASGSYSLTLDRPRERSPALRKPKPQVVIRWHKREIFQSRLELASSPSGADPDPLHVAHSLLVFLRQKLLGGQQAAHATVSTHSALVLRTLFRYLFVIIPVSISTRPPHSASWSSCKGARLLLISCRRSEVTRHLGQTPSRMHTAQQRTRRKSHLEQKEGESQAEQIQSSSRG
jgi:hypothetical protein